MPVMLLSGPAPIIRKSGQFTYKKCAPPSKQSCRRYCFGILNAGCQPHNSTFDEQVVYKTSELYNSYRKIQQDATVYQNFIIPYLYETQHVSGDTPPIIRSLKLH